jgi:hypothetical protein
MSCLFYVCKKCENAKSLHLQNLTDDGWHQNSSSRTLITEQGNMCYFLASAYDDLLQLERLFEFPSSETVFKEKYSV